MIANQHHAMQTHTFHENPPAKKSSKQNTTDCLIHPSTNLDPIFSCFLLALSAKVHLLALSAKRFLSQDCFLTPHLPEVQKKKIQSLNARAWLLTPNLCVYCRETEREREILILIYVRETERERVVLEREKEAITVKHSPSELTRVWSKFRKMQHV